MITDNGVKIPNYDALVNAHNELMKKITNRLQQITVYIHAIKILWLQRRMLL